MYDLSFPIGLDTELGILAATLIDGTREWKEQLEFPAPEAVSWQQYAYGPSIGGLILHIVRCESYWLSMALDLDEDKFDPAFIYDSSVDQSIHHWPPPPKESIEWYYQLHEKQRTRSLERIARHNRPNSIHSRRDESFSFRWILAHLVQHDSYTGGQAVLLHEAWKKRQG
jgi:uncharacterized damage-inducible protein DinB